MLVIYITEIQYHLPITNFKSTSVSQLSQVAVSIFEGGNLKVITKRH